jgi:hypothetical protein
MRSDCTNKRSSVAAKRFDNGVFGGCWCMGFHPDDSREPALNRERKLTRVRAGRAHAALVFHGDDVWVGASSARRTRCRRSRTGLPTRGASPAPGAGSVGADAAGVRADARASVPERRAVHPPRPRTGPARPAALAHERAVRPRLLRGQAGRPGHHRRRADPDQTHVAHFWAEPSPSGWSRVANLVSARYGYDLHDTARLQALLNMAMAEGFIVAGSRSVTSPSGGR